MAKRKTPAERAAALERIAEVAATEYVSLWGEPARVPLDALPAIGKPPAPRMPRPKVVGNPCVALYGAGSAGRKCRGCAHLLNSRGYTAKVYYKCDLRKLTHGPGSDHRVNWPACAKFQAKAAEDE